jgi:hypothetical protein
MLGAVVLAMAGMFVPATAGAAPDFALTDAAILDPLVPNGGRTKVLVPVRNLGRDAAPATTITFFLSTDARFGGDRVLGGTGLVAKLGPRASRNVTTLVTLPAGLRVDDYRVFACVDQRHLVREASDANNCLRVGEPIVVEPKSTPVRVTPQLATGAAVFEQTVSAAQGGRVIATTADGTFYSLSIPAGALANDTRISMKPLASLGGLPFAGGLTAGVQLEPRGLEFAKPAMLVISGDRINAAAANTTFAYDASGTGFHITPPLRDVPAELQTGLDPAKTVYVPVLHFSGAGIAPATTQEQAVQQRKGAANARDRLAQDLRKTLQEQGDSAALFEQYVDQVLLPEAAAASFSDAMYEAALRDHVSWQRMRDLAGNGPQSARLKAKLAQLEQLLDAAWKQVVKRADERCRQGGFDVIGRIIPLERLRVLAGLGGTPNEFSAITERCWRFELKVRSTVTRDSDGGVPGFRGAEHMVWTLEGKVPLRLRGESGGVEVAIGQLFGAAPFPYVVRQYTGDGDIDFGAFGSERCQYSWAGTTTAGQITVHDGSILTRYAGPLEPYFEFDLGEPTESIHHDCHGTAFGQPTNNVGDEDEHHFMKWWRSAHAEWSADSNPGAEDDAGKWTVKLQPGRHPIVGQLTYTKAWPDLGTSMTETWTLTHKPLAVAS